VDGLGGQRDKSRLNVDGIFMAIQAVLEPP
jgi:hypothetical protein